MMGIIMLIPIIIYCVLLAICIMFVLSHKKLADAQQKMAKHIGEIAESLKKE